MGRVRTRIDEMAAIESTGLFGSSFWVDDVQTARPKVPMHRLGADCFVVALKRGNARGAKGAGHRHLARVNRQREEPDVQWKAAAFGRWHEPYDARVSSPVL
jgi:hypothetical protein